MAQTLRVHPAAVLVTALIAANLLGVIGVVIAAPFLASLMLLGRYTMRKMLDMNPWPPGETVPVQPISFEWVTRTKEYLETRFQKARSERDIAKEKVYGKDRSDE
jgi:hypothetical protein